MSTSREDIRVWLKRAKKMPDCTLGFLQIKFMSLMVQLGTLWVVIQLLGQRE